MSKLGLEKLFPSREFADAAFSDDEWQEIETAYKRGATMQDIQDATRRYPSRWELWDGYIAWHDRKCDKKATP